MIALSIIRPAVINDSIKIEGLVEVMIGDENPKQTAKLVVNDFFENNKFLTFIIEIAENVVGFGVLKLDSFEGANGVAEFVWLGVNERYKRNALGTALVKHIENYAIESKIRKIYVKTSINNNSINCFWIMQNYKFEARMKDFSLKSHDDYYLGKDI